MPLLATLALALAGIPSAWAGPQVATLTAVQGEVKIFSHPSAKSPSGPPPHARYENLYYSVKDAKVGDRIEKGNLLRTQPGGRAKVIYDNGDQIYVARATFYKTDWKNDSAENADPVLELRYGKARFMIQKGGPRGKFRIKTKSAVLGVRGTDFFVAVNDATGETETATLRGSVDVKPLAEGATSTPVNAGQTASVLTETIAPPEVNLHATTLEELQAVQQNSVLQTPEPAPPQMLDAVKDLETVAENATLADIRAIDPTTAARLEEAPPSSEPRLDALNRATIDKLMEAAPSSSVIGPIADKALEKGIPKEPEKKPEAEDPLPNLPGWWLGVRFGDHGAKLDNGDNNAVVSGVSTKTENLDSPAFALTAEYEVGRNFSLLAELYPSLRHGSAVDLSCSGSCPPNSSGRFELKVSSIDLLLGVKPGIPFGRTRVFGLHTVLAFRLSKITQAELVEPGGSIQELSLVDGLKLSFGAGVGLDVRPWQHLKLSLDIRAERAVGDLAGSPVPVGGTIQRLGPMLDFYFLLGGAYGL